jgi:hypothetical protein
MLSGALHRALDHFAIWTEDRVRRAPEPCVLAPPAPLACFGALPPLPDTSPDEGTWSTPSPWPLAGGDRLWIRATPAQGPRRGTALLVPPWKIGRPTLVSGWVTLLTRGGWDTWLLCPPHHLERTAPGARSGEGFVSLDLARTRAVFEQLVVEIRASAALARARGPVALVGLSLGALAAALALTAPEPFDAGALVAPPSLAGVLADTGIGRRYRRLAERSGSGWPAGPDFAAALAPLDPAGRAPTTRRILLAAAAHDRVATPAGALRLAQAWGLEPAVYPRGHLSLLFACAAVRRDVATLLTAAVP